MEAFIGVEEAVAAAASTTSALRRLAWASTRIAAPWAPALAARSHRSRLHLRTSSSSNLRRSSPAAAASTAPAAAATPAAPSTAPASAAGIQARRPARPRLGARSEHCAASGGLGPARQPPTTGAPPGPGPTPTPPPAVPSTAPGPPPLPRRAAESQQRLHRPVALRHRPPGAPVQGLSKAQALAVPKAARCRVGLSLAVVRAWALLVATRSHLTEVAGSPVGAGSTTRPTTSSTIRAPSRRPGTSHRGKDIRLGGI